MDHKHSSICHVGMGLCVQNVFPLYTHTEYIALYTYTCDSWPIGIPVLKLDHIVVHVV